MRSLIQSSLRLKRAIVYSSVEDHSELIVRKILPIVTLLALCPMVVEAKPIDRTVKRDNSANSASKAQVQPKVGTAKLAKVAGSWKSINLGGGILKITADGTYQLTGRFDYKRNNEPIPDVKGTVAFKGVESVHGTRREVYSFTVLGVMCLFEDSPELGPRFYNYSEVRPSVYHKVPK